MNNVEFGDWLQIERGKKGWSQSDLARYSGLHRAIISKLESGTNPMPETLSALAKAFNISPVVIFRKAGLLPESQSEQVKLEDWEYLLSQLPLDDQEELRQIAEMKIKKREKDQSLKFLKSKKVKA